MSATKRSYDEISQGDKETTDKKINKGNKARKTPDVPVNSPIIFPMITEDKDANTVDEQDKTSKQATGGSGFFWMPETKRYPLLLAKFQELTHHCTQL